MALKVGAGRWTVDGAGVTGRWAMDDGTMGRWVVGVTRFLQGCGKTQSLVDKCNEQYKAVHLLDPIMLNAIVFKLLLLQLSLSL